MKKIHALVAGIVAIATAGCVSIGRTEQNTLLELQSYGIDDEAIKVKSPAVAGVLNVLPGFGNFYLGTGTDQGIQWAYGFGNLLFWPLSVLWGVPAAVADAHTINRRETVYYYTLNPAGQKELARYKAAAENVAGGAAPVPAPTPSSAVAVPLAPAAPAPAALVQGQRASVRQGVALSSQPKPGVAAATELQGGREVELVSRLDNGPNPWWFVNQGGRHGWVLESDLLPVVEAAVAP